MEKDKVYTNYSRKYGKQAGIKARSVKEVIECAKRAGDTITAADIKLLNSTRKNKYCYGWNIYTNYGYGWEVESTYDKKETSYAQVKKDAREYRIAGANVRITKTRWFND